jgi:hypothetical protein
MSPDLILAFRSVTRDFECGILSLPSGGEKAPDLPSDIALVIAGRRGIPRKIVELRGSVISDGRDIKRPRRGLRTGTKELTD